MLRAVVSICVVALSSSSAAVDQPRIQVADTSYQFGHVGIDYKIFHNFLIRNVGATPARIDSITVPCDCSLVTLEDSTVSPGEALTLSLTYATKDMYGQNTKNLIIYSSDPAMRRIDVNYHATIGQWLTGLKPNPIALFFLSGQNEKKLTIPGSQFDRYRLTAEEPVESYVEVAVKTRSVARGGSAEILVTVSDDLKPGDYYTSFRLRADIDDSPQPVYLTIPVKIVRY